MCSTTSKGPVYALRQATFLVLLTLAGCASGPSEFDQLMAQSQAQHEARMRWIDTLPPEQAIRACDVFIEQNRRSREGLDQLMRDQEMQRQTMSLENIAAALNGYGSY